MSAHYYITKGQKTVGPCSLDDLRAYLAYGSVRESDLVRQEGVQEWTPLRYLAELQLNSEGAPTAEEITTRRRTARYRDYERVPFSQRSGVVLLQLVSGFLLFPPVLWKGAITIFQNRIYRPKRDVKGYLLHWPKWTESVTSALLILNGLLWACLVWWVSRKSSTLVRELSSFIATSMTDLQDWLGK